MRDERTSKELVRRDCCRGGLLNRNEGRCRMSVTLTDHEAACVLLLLKSITYERISGEDGLKFQATLFNLGERIEIEHEESEVTQYALWESLGTPAWENTARPEVTSLGEEAR